MVLNPGDSDIRAKGRRQPSAEAAQMYTWIGRLATLAWLLGTVLVSIYVISTDGINFAGLLMVSCALMGLVVTAIVPWSRAERWWVLPVVGFAAVLIAVATAVLNKPGISAFHLFPLMFVAYFYWGRPRFMVPLFAAWAALFTASEIARSGPVGTEQLIVAMPTFLAAAALVGVLADRFRVLSRSERRRFKATVEALCTALSARDGYTGEHSAETLELVLSVTNELDMGLSEVELISDVALLHDIGKIGIPNEILHAPGRLDEQQWDVMKQHPVIGERIVAAVPGLEVVAKAIRHEHERWDGLGYPDGLKGDEIPMPSRIVLVCDAFHAMTSDRPYRAALPEHEARAELVRNAGTQFDPVVVGALLAALARNPVFTAYDRQNASEPAVTPAAIIGGGSLASSA
ncbi:MAG: HD-GYP domain-containing protein [Thermoleophilaceae bacterium]|nr:HD-GYP domain-containing protein [Thermoleophilaceae bacterium]